MTKLRRATRAMAMAMAREATTKPARAPKAPTPRLALQARRARRDQVDRWAKDLLARVLAPQAVWLEARAGLRAAWLEARAGRTSARAGSSSLLPNRKSSGRTIWKR